MGFATGLFNYPGSPWVPVHGHPAGAVPGAMAPSPPPPPALSNIAVLPARSSPAHIFVMDPMFIRITSSKAGWATVRIGPVVKRVWIPAGTNAIPVLAPGEARRRFPSGTHPYAVSVASVGGAPILAARGVLIQGGYPPRVSSSNHRHPILGRKNHP